MQAHIFKQDLSGCCVENGLKKAKNMVEETPWESTEEFQSLHYGRLEQGGSNTKCSSDVLSPASKYCLFLSGSDIR